MLQTITSGIILELDFSIIRKGHFMVYTKPLARCTRATATSCVDSKLRIVNHAYLPKQDKIVGDNSRRWWMQDKAVNLTTEKHGITFQEPVFILKTWKETTRASPGSARGRITTGQVLKSSGKRKPQSPQHCPKCSGTHHAWWTWRSTIRYGACTSTPKKPPRLSAPRKPSPSGTEPS